MIITRPDMLRATTFVRLQIAQRRNFFERGVNTVRWARLRHRHNAISLSHKMFRLYRTYSNATTGKERSVRSPPQTNVAHRAARLTDWLPALLARSATIRPRWAPTDRVIELGAERQPRHWIIASETDVPLHEMPRTFTAEVGGPKQISFL